MTRPDHIASLTLALLAVLAAPLLAPPPTTAQRGARSRSASSLR